MAVQITSATFPDRFGRLGPYLDSDGHLWVLLRNASNYLAAYKSEDGGASWSAQAATSINPSAVDSVFDAANGVIYVALVDPSTVKIKIYSYTISSNEWAEVYDGSSTRPTPYTDVLVARPLFLARRSGGEFVVVHQGPTHSGGYRSVYYTRCSSAGVWETGVEVDAGAEFHYDVKNAVLGASDRVHTVYVSTDSLGNTSLRHRSIDSSNVLSTTDSLGATQIGSGNYYTAYYNSSLGKVVVDKGGTLVRGNSSSTPVWTSDGSAFISGGAEEVSWCGAALVWQPTLSRLYIYWRDGPSDDILRNYSVGTAWATPVTQEYVVVLGISVGLVADGIQGILFNDNGTVYFDTLFLFAAVGHSAGLPYKLSSGVGHSAILRYALSGIVGTSRVLRYTVTTTRGTSRILRYTVTTGVGKSRVLPYAMRQFIGYSVGFRYSVITILGWQPPLMADIDYSRLPFIEAQEALDSPPEGTSATAIVGWHGTRIDPERGSVAIVRSDGPLASLLGERVRITYAIPGGSRSVVAYVHSRSAAIEDDISVSRRVFLGLAPPPFAPLSARVEVLA